MSAVAWLLAAILGFFIGGTPLAVVIILVGIAWSMFNDLVKMLVSPAGLGAILGFGIVEVILWLVYRTTGYCLESAPLWVQMATLFGPPSVAAILSDGWSRSRNLSTYKPPSIVKSHEGSNSGPQSG